MKRLIVTIALPLFTVLALFSQTVSAAGFAIIEQSVKGLGNAFAGGAAIADDPTTIFFNPAGMTRLGNKQQFVYGGHIIIPSAKFSDNGSNIGGTPLTGGDGGDAGEIAFVPNFYWVKPINGKLIFGLGVNAPFGLVTEYDSDWKGRYHAIKSDLMTININPSLAYRVNDKLSIGGGINAQYIDVELTNNVALGGGQVADARAKVTGDDWGFGLNLGLLYEFNKGTRLGVAYRSKIDQSLQGSAEFDDVSGSGALGAAQAGGFFLNTGAKADLTLPETLSISVYRQLNPKWAIMGDVTWTRWSRFKELRVRFDVGNQGDTVVPENWEDSYRYAVGLNYIKNQKWTLRGGIALDETPIPSAEFRTARIPGNDRKWLTFGATYKRSDKLTVDFGFAHLFISNTPINNTGSQGHILTGSYDADVNIISVQFNLTR